MIKFVSRSLSSWAFWEGVRNWHSLGDRMLSEVVRKGEKHFWENTLPPSHHTYLVFVVPFENHSFVGLTFSFVCFRILLCLVHTLMSLGKIKPLPTHSQVTQPLAYFPTMEKHQIIFFIDDKKAVILFFYVWMAFYALLAILRVLCSERWWLHLSSQFVTKCYSYFSRLAFVTPFKLKGLMLLCKRIHILWPLPKIASRYFVKMLPTDYQQTLRKRTLGGPNLLRTHIYTFVFICSPPHSLNRLKKSTQAWRW